MSALERTDAMVSASRLQIMTDKRLRLNGHYDSLTAWRMLSRHVARHPKNLRVHTQRVFLAEDSMLRHCLKGALVDLTISLQGKGESFSQQLLDMVKDSLNSDDYQEIKRSLIESVNEPSKFQDWTNGSVVANGADDGRSLVVREQVQQGEFTSRLEEARSCMEYGQLDDALSILQQEMLSQPENEEVEAELLNLFQYLRDKEQFASFTSTLENQEIALSENWREVEADSNNWT